MADGADALRPAAGGPCRGEADPAVQPDGPWAAIHPSYLERLLWNLLSNAVKYTPSGGEVTVTLRAAAGQVLLTVADSGVGIPRSSRRTSSTAIWRSCGCRLPTGSGAGPAPVSGHCPWSRRAAAVAVRPGGYHRNGVAAGSALHQNGVAGAALRLRRRLSSGAAGAGGCPALYGLHPEKIWTDGPTYDIRIPALAGKDTRGNGAWRKNEFW